MSDRRPAQPERGAGLRTCVTVPRVDHCLLPRLTSGAGLRLRSVTGHQLGLKRIDRGADTLGVLGGHLTEERKLPLDDSLGYSLHGLGVIREEPLLLLGGEEAKERAGLREVV